tara:strand:+ start:768 stop:1268 length:501 start_codon:yes stop_codon:yes gene_type:complete
MKTIFIGTRIEALEKLENLTVVSKIITTKNSYIDKKKNKKIIINKDNIQEINSLLVTSDVDLIFSSGYPFILSKEILRSNKVFINSHPSYLPDYKGRRSIKRAFDNNEEFYGCTLHYMNENVDSGEIIYQKKISLKNLTLSEIYEFIFSKLEVEVIETGLKKILNK